MIKRRSAPRGRRRWRVFAWLLGVVVCALLFLAGPSGLVRIVRLELRRRSLESEIYLLRAKVELVNQRKKRLQTDTAYVRRLATQRYHMVELGPRGD